MMAVKSVRYQWSSEDVLYENSVDVNEVEWQRITVGDLRKMIWQQERDVFSSYGVKSSSQFLLWQKEGTVPLELNRRLSEVYIICANTVHLSVFVTPHGARSSLTAFVSFMGEDKENALQENSAAMKLAMENAAAIQKLAMENAAAIQKLTKLSVENAAAINKLTKVLEAVPAISSNAVAIKKLATLFDMFVKIEVEGWKESTPSRTGDGGDFKKSLVHAYGDPNENYGLICMATGKHLPYKYVTAAHIVGVKLRMQALVLLKIDVDSTQNGILWCSPIEQAWSFNKICFSWSAIDNTYILLVLDDKLRDVELGRYVKGIPQAVDDILGNLTFGQLHGRKMVFQNAFRPYKRAFLLMSWLKKEWALQAGCNPMFTDADHYDFDYWSAGTYKEKVMTWLNAQDLVVPDEDTLIYADTMSVDSRSHSGCASK